MTTCTFRFMLLFILLLIPTAATGERTALHEAAAKGHLGIVKALLEAGADAEARGMMGQTPRDLATRKDIIRLLDQATNKETP